MSSTAMLLLALLLISTSVTAFTALPFQRHATLSRNGLAGVMKDDFESDFPPEEGSEEYKSDVDWDAEWKKVVTNKDQPERRPGSDYYKSDVEVSTIKAAKKAQEQLSKIPKPDMNWSSLQGDWKFWIGILAIISVGTSLIAGSGQQQMYSNDSFYV